MRFDLAALVGVETAARYREVTDFLGSEIRALGAARVAIGLLGDFGEQIEFRGREDGGLICARDEIHITVQLAKKAGRFSVQ